MGMFDSIYAAAKCPNCGDEGEKELQTKDLRCDLDTYRVGDSIGTTQFRFLDCSAGCRTNVCHEWQKNRDGYRSGFGYVWACYAEIDEHGVITGKILAELPSPASQDGRAEG